MATLHFTVLKWGVLACYDPAIVLNIGRIVEDVTDRDLIVSLRKARKFIQHPSDPSERE